MKTAKKVISVFLVCVLTVTVFSLGFTGIAASIDLDQQYVYLSDYLKNEYVRDLSNYKVTNTMCKDAYNQGFNTSAKAFAYDHIVTASDNEPSDITKAANRFFYIAESLMSTVSGTGYYTAHLLYEKIINDITPYFDGKLYVDSKGELYTPTEYELSQYEEAVAVLKAAEYDITLENIKNLAIYDIDFIEISEFDYYNVATVVSYFMGTGTYINAGNWYHNYLFAVETSVERVLLDAPDIWSMNNDDLDIYVGLYLWKYQRSFDETRTKAKYFFDACDESEVLTAFGAKYGISAGRNFNASLFNYRGQAENFIMNKHVDSTTVAYLQSVYAIAEDYITPEGLGEGEKWDAVRGIEVGKNFAQATNTQLHEWSIGTRLKAEVKELASNYSNDVLNHIYGSRMGNIVRLAYIATANGDLETAVRDTDQLVATYSSDPYEVDCSKINAFIDNFDNLVNGEDATDEEIETASNVAAILKQFFNTNADLFVGTPAYGIEFDNLTELVEQMIVAFLFNDAMMTKIISLIYPLLCKTVIGLFDGLTGWEGLNQTLANIVNGLIEDNDMALYPNALANRISAHNPSHYYDTAVTALNNAGEDWDAVVWDNIIWGIDDTIGFDNKADRFVDALSVVLSGVYTLLKLLLCGDREYCSKNAYDLSILSGLGHMYAQGGYTKLFVPIFRALGLTELASYSPNNCNGYVSSAVYHNFVGGNETYASRMLVEPLIYWVTDCLAKNPIKEICKLIPNLVNLVTRTSDVEITEDGAASGSDIEFTGFSTVQTHNIYTILQHVHINVQVRVIGFSAYTLHYDVISLLNTAVNKYNWDMLKSVNTILEGFLDLKYETDEFESSNICAYSNDDGSRIVLPESAAYQTDPDSYPNGHYLVYANGNYTSFSLLQDEDHPYEYTDYNYVEIPYKLPDIEEAKVCGIGTRRSDYNTLVLEETPSIPGSSDCYGLTLLFLLRYVFSSLGYKYNDSVENLPYLIECFGIETDKALVSAVTLGDIVFNGMLRPDDAVCALMELFYEHDTGTLNKETLTDTSLYPIENVEYYNDVLLDMSINPTLSYGPDVIYSKYWTKERAGEVTGSIGTLINNVLKLLRVSGFENGVSGFVSNLVEDNLFTDSIMNKLFNLIYKLLGGLSDTTGFDIELVLDAALGVSYSPNVIGDRLHKMLGFDPQAVTLLRGAETWADVFPDNSDVDWDWGLDADTAYAEAIAETGYSQGEIFIRIASALLSPVDFFADFLLLDKDFEILNLISLPSYAGYQYSVISLLETLTCPAEKILSYQQYYDATVGNTADTDIASCNRFYFILSPILGLIDNLCADPISTVFELIPNLMFFMSIGAVNDLLNNFVHFAYVLLDIVSPVANFYYPLNELLSAVKIKGVALNLSLPLEIDMNQLLGSLITGLLGDSLTLAEDEITGAKLNIVLPYIDFYTLCVGNLIKYSSKENRVTLHLGGDDGSGILTAVLRLAIEVIFIDENKENIIGYISQTTEGLDDYDRETLMLVMNKMYDLMDQYQLPDIVLFALYYLVTEITPLSGKLADIFTKTDFTFTEFITSIGNIGKEGGMTVFISYVKQVVAAAGISTESPTGSTTTGEAAMGLLQKIKTFFEKIITLFKSLFNFV